MESKSYDVVLLPELNIAEKAIKLSQTVEDLGTHFTLREDEYFPHVSLYMLQLNVEGLNQAEDILETIANDTETIEVQASEYHYEKGYFDIQYHKTTELIDLQNQIIKQLNSVRDGLRAKDEKLLRAATGEEKANVEQFGHRNVGNLFAPHLTFTRFKDYEINSLNNLPAEDSFSGNFVALGIFEMGDHGTCRQKVRDWALKQ